MPDRIHNVLFLCTHNSARSIMAEALLNHLSEGRSRAFSAGSEGGPRPKPMALKILEAEDVPTAGLTSKAWDVFTKPGAPVMDLVITAAIRRRAKRARFGRGSRSPRIGASRTRPTFKAARSNASAPS